MNTPEAIPEANRKKKKKGPQRPPAEAAARSAAREAQAPVSLPSLQRDDLVNIEGVDPATELALNSIGIRQFSDFRGQTPESLAQALQAHGVLSITAEKIIAQDWLAWAEMFATENALTPLPPPAENEMPATGAPAAASAQEISQPANSNKQRSRRVRHMKGKHKETPLPQNVSPAEPRSSDGAALRIAGVRFVQVETPATAFEPSAKKLYSEIQCELAGPRESKHELLCLQVYALEEFPGAYLMLSSHCQRLHADQTQYRAEIECQIPAAGRYQLYVIAFLLQSSPPISLYQGPTLRVIP